MSHQPERALTQYYMSITTLECELVEMSHQPERALTHKAMSFFIFPSDQ